MNLLILGWYHHKNAGDDRIQEALVHWLDGHTLAFMPAGRNLPLSLIRQYDGVIVGGGGLLTQADGLSKNLLEWRRKTKKTIALIGVSLESNDEQLKSQLIEFVKESALVKFRDEGSCKSLHLDIDNYYAPDLTFLKPFAWQSQPEKKEQIGFCLRNEAVFDNAKWKKAVENRNAHFVPWPFYSEYESDQKQLRTLFPDTNIPDSFMPHLAENMRMIVTGRFHGLLFAIQMGIPCLVVSSRNKVRRFVEQHGLEAYRIDEDQPQLLSEKMDLIEKEYSGYRKKMKTIRTSLRHEAKVSYEVVKQQLLEEVDQYPTWRKKWDRIRNRIFR